MLKNKIAKKVYYLLGIKQTQWQISLSKQVSNKGKQLSSGNQRSNVNEIIITIRSVIQGPRYVYSSIPDAKGILCVANEIYWAHIGQVLLREKIKVESYGPRTLDQANLYPVGGLSIVYKTPIKFLVPAI